VAGNTVLLFPNTWSCNYFIERNPKITLVDLPPRDSTHATSS